MSLLNSLLGLGSTLALRAESLLGSPRLSVLTFHRVLAQVEPVFNDGVNADLFDRWIGYFARNFNVHTLGDAVACMQQGTLPARALVITFDDGYADNAEVALPILQRHGVPATFFIATGYLDGGCMWNDQVVHCFRRTSKTAVDLANMGLGHLPLTTVQQREHAIRVTLASIKYMASAERERALLQLASMTTVTDRPLNLMMRSEQVQALARQGMEIGGHTVNHPILALATEADAGAEIVRGRQHLLDLVDAPVEVFAYPNGQPGKDYTAVHVRQVRQAGFRCAVSTAKGTSGAGDDLFQLPRIMPWGDDPRRLSARLVASRRAHSFDRVGPAA